MTCPVLFCSTCGHWADKHAGSQGCIGRNDDGSDCFCTSTYSHITRPPSGAGMNSRPAPVARSEEEAEEGARP